MNIDQEWENFISSGCNEDDISSDEEVEYNKSMNIGNNNIVKSDKCDPDSHEYSSADLSAYFNTENVTAPQASNIYISTKTKIAYLNTIVDLKTIFWAIPVIPYTTPKCGVIKKQMKFNSITRDEFDIIQTKLQDETCCEENIITHIDNPDGRIKFKDIRKISIGISKKDIMSYRCKKKSAFYNCFVIILRMKFDTLFKEFHVKVFNTGKLEIPGIQTESSFQVLLEEVINVLQPHFADIKLGYKDSNNETVLINSNFNCGFYINREALYDILKTKYNIQAIYDPCSYPGIQCKFYYNSDLQVQNGSPISEDTKHLYKDIKDVSFMIFRTGSVLIVGKCDENVLITIYEFLKKILTIEFRNICQNYIPGDGILPLATKEKSKKIRRKSVIINV
jgi:hypothetical protein